MKAIGCRQFVKGLQAGHFLGLSFLGADDVGETCKDHLPQCPPWFCAVSLVLFGSVVGHQPFNLQTFS